MDRESLRLVKQPQKLKYEELSQSRQTSSIRSRQPKKLNDGCNNYLYKSKGGMLGQGAAGHHTKSTNDPHNFVGHGLMSLVPEVYDSYDP